MHNRLRISVSLFFVAAYIAAAQYPSTMHHRGRVQAIVNEYHIPTTGLTYNHEGDITQANNGDLVCGWECTLGEGTSWGMVMLSRFDGEKWIQPYPADAGYIAPKAPVPYQPKKAGAPMLLFINKNGYNRGSMSGGKRYIATSTDNGWTWQPRGGVPAPDSDDPFIVEYDYGTFGACDIMQPLELPDGTLWCGTVAGDKDEGYGYITVIPPDNYTGNVPGGTPWSFITPTRDNYFTLEYAGFISAIMPMSDDYQQITAIAWGSRNNYKGCAQTWTTDGGQTWSAWQDISFGSAHPYAIPLDWDNGGPLKGWYVFALDQGGGSYSRDAVDVYISNDTRNWEKALSLGYRPDRELHPERCAQGIVQSADRKLHITSAGRGAGYVWHFEIDPDVLIGNTTPNSAGVLNLCGKRYVTEGQSSDASVSVVRTGGAAGTASVKYVTVDADAKAGVDYTAASGTLTWADGDMGAKKISVPIADDNVAQGRRHFYVDIFEAQGASVGGVARTEINISEKNERDSDYTGRGVIYFESDTFYAYENTVDSLMWIVVHWPDPYTPIEQNTISVDYSTSDMTAQAGSDYLSATGTVELGWRKGYKFKEFSIPISDNNAKDGDRIFKLTLSNPSTGLSLGVRKEAICKIIDDEGGTNATTISAGSSLVNFAGAQIRAAASGNGALFDLRGRAIQYSQTQNVGSSDHPSGIVIRRIITSNGQGVLVRSVTAK
ncbi:MAG: hypothetical protein GF350_06495 [Chitinivibrionales bacterium]|nr:hypothetical protein [Chitinivibrionales bacterium]